ncbi:MAG: hypothetical protein AAGG59_06070 [Bacteroidota bacterium]
MKDNLKDFVDKNRSLFDDMEPSDSVWKGIEKRTSKRSYHWLWKAAAISFFCTTLFLFFTNQVDRGEELISQKEKISSDFVDIESFYFQMISEKKTLIQSYADETELDYGYEQDLQNLDAMYEVLKDELKTNPSKKVVDALLLNLVVRIDILNKELAQLDDNTAKPEPEDAAI